MMLALLGLMGLAFLGMAFIGSGTSDTDNDLDELDEPSHDIDSESQPDPAVSEEAEGVLLDGRSGGAADEADVLVGSDVPDVVVAGRGDVIFGGGGNDTYDISGAGVCYIQDYEADELIIISYDGDPPAIDYDATDGGMAILADGYPIAILRDVYSIEPSSILLSPVSENVVAG